MNSLLCRTVLSQNTKSCMVVKRANSFLVRSSKVPNGTLPFIYQTRTIISGSSLNRKEKLTFEEQELKNKETFARKCTFRIREQKWRTYQRQLYITCYQLHYFFSVLDSGRSHFIGRFVNLSEWVTLHR